MSPLDSIIAAPAPVTAPDAVALLGWLFALAAMAIAWLVHMAGRRRAELVARACHELAGPLSAAGLALETARREGAGPRVAAVDAELKRVARALEDLDAARAGRRARDSAGVVDVGCLLAQQALAWQPAARSRGAHLRVVAASGLLVRGDAVRIGQAVGNLLANALEHGGPRIDLVAAAAGGSVRVEVRDDGDGLPAPVATLTRTARAGRGERGRGLAIASEIAVRHGGRLASAPAASGATLVIELPRARSVA
jgi:signal transduction histidine kinase